MAEAPLVGLPLPRAYGGPVGQGCLRRQPEDFRVEEVLSFAPSGAGEHVLLQLRKRGENTQWVARQIARTAGVSEKDVGYAGLKDRHAVTTQWFSVGLAGRAEPDWSALTSDSVQLLRVVRHDRKLRPGAILRNRFYIRVADVSGIGMKLEECLGKIREGGVPNYFGEQRFGHDSENIEKAQALFEGRLRVRDRKLRGIYLSSARSWLFNAVLAERVAAGTWNRIMAGDAMNLDGRRAVFLAETLDDDLLERVAALDIHPTGPLWGRGEPMTRGEPASLEISLATSHPVLSQGLASVGMDQERRALRCRVQELDWVLADHDLELSFSLPSGSFATAVVRELIDYRQTNARE